MKVLSLIIAVFFSTAVMAQPLIVSCNVKMKKSQRSKIVKLRIKKSFSSKEFQIKNFKVKMKGKLEGRGYGSTLKLVFEVTDKTLVSRNVEIIGRKVKLKHVSYGSLAPFILFNGFRKQDLIARCNLD